MPIMKSSHQLRLDELSLEDNVAQTRGNASVRPAKISAETTVASDALPMEDAIPFSRNVDDDDIAQSTRRTKRSSETTTSPTSEISSFRILDLPREIRDQIYEEVLTCNEFAKDLEVEYSPYERSPDSGPPPCRGEPTFVDHQVTVALLLANRQIYHEAYLLMMARNVFVRLTVVDNELFETDMKNSFVPILAQGTAARQFKSPAIDIAISGRFGGTYEGSLDSYPTYIFLVSSLDRIADVINWLVFTNLWSLSRFQELRLFPPGDIHVDQRTLGRHLEKLIIADSDCLRKVGPWPGGEKHIYVWPRSIKCLKSFLMHILDSVARPIDVGNTYFRRRAFRLASRYYGIAAARSGRGETEADGMRIDLRVFFAGTGEEDCLHALERLQYVIRSSISATAWELAKINSGDPQKAEWAVLNMKDNDVACRQWHGIEYARFRLEKATLDSMRARWVEADRFLESLGIHQSSSAPVWQEPVIEE